MYMYVYSNPCTVHVGLMYSVSVHKHTYASSVHVQCISSSTNIVLRLCSIFKHIGENVWKYGRLIEWNFYIILIMLAPWTFKNRTVTRKQNAMLMTHRHSFTSKNKAISRESLDGPYLWKCGGREGAGSSRHTRAPWLSAWARWPGRTSWAGWCRGGPRRRSAWCSPAGWADPAEPGLGYPALAGDGSSWSWCRLCCLKDILL